MTNNWSVGIWTPCNAVILSRFSENALFLFLYFMSTSHHSSRSPLSRLLLLCQCTTGSILYSGLLLIIHALLDTQPNPSTQAETLTRAEILLTEVELLYQFRVCPNLT